MNENIEKKYIIDHTAPFFEIQGEMERFAELHHVPILSRDSLDLLVSLIKIKKPKRILEFGTATAYSAIAMAVNMPDDGEIITIERNDKRFDEATRNIHRMRLQNKIKIFQIDATEAHDIIAQNAPYDFVFIDAAKGQYRLFFDMAFPHVSKGGVMVSDNMFHKGIVFEEHISRVEKRQRTIYKRMRAYIDFLKKDNDLFFSTLLPVGDGVAITYKV